MVITKYMITYELAKKLKDAGFLQKDRGDFVSPPDIEIINSPLAIYVPTLSELIEACGDRFESLERWLPQDKMPWRVFMSDEAFKEYSIEYPCVKECCGYTIGDSPEEAVTNLWLKLNEK